MRSYLAALALVSISFAPESLAVTPEEISAKQTAVKALQDRLAPRVTPLLVSGSDVRAFLSLAPIAQGVAAIAATPAAARTIRVQSTGANGRFWEDGDWCHSFVELQSPDSFNASVELTNLVGSILDSGAIQVSTRAVSRGKVQVKFQFKGRRVSGPLGIGNVCPPGGGVGTSIGVEFEKDSDLVLQVSLSRGSDGHSVAYAASFVSPEKVEVTAQIGLGAIGTIGHPMSLPLSRTPLASGSFPLLLAQEGKFTVYGGGERTYSLIMTPQSFVVNQAGITATWKSTVQFK